MPLSPALLLSLVLLVLVVLVAMTALSFLRTLGIVFPVTELTTGRAWKTGLEFLHALLLFLGAVTTTFLEESPGLFHFSPLLLCLCDISTSFLVGCSQLDRNVLVVVRLFVLLGLVTVNFIGACLIVATLSFFIAGRYSGSGLIFAR